MSGLPSTLRWSPVRGCEDPDVATRRALVITADSALKGENAAWQKRSDRAAMPAPRRRTRHGEGVTAFRRWSSNPVLAREALDILGRPDAALGWQADLMGIIDDDSRNTSNSWIGVTAAVAPLSSPKVLAALDPRGSGGAVRPEDLHRATRHAVPHGHEVRRRGRRAVPFRPDRRHRPRSPGNGLRRSRRTPRPAAVTDPGRDSQPVAVARAARSSSPTAAASASPPSWSCSHSRRPRSGWSIDEAATIWDAAIIKVIFGGGSDERDLRSLAGLIGERNPDLQHPVLVTPRAARTANRSANHPSYPCTRSAAYLPAPPSCSGGAAAPSCWTCANGTSAATPSNWATPRNRPNANWWQGISAPARQQATNPGTRRPDEIGRRHGRTGTKRSSTRSAGEPRTNFAALLFGSTKGGEPTGSR